MTKNNAPQAEQEDDAFSDPDFLKFFNAMQANKAKAAAEAIRNDPSLTAGKNSVINIHKNQMNEESFLKELLLTNGNTLKLTSIALLLKHLSESHDVSNCIIAHDPKFIDKAKYTSPKLNEVINYALQKNNDLNIIYKASSNHNTLIAYRQVAEQKFFYIIDSLGDKGKDFDELQSAITKTINDSNHGANTYVIASTEQRQKDRYTCSVFVYKDLKLVLSNPDLLNKIVKLSGNLQSVKECQGFNYFNEFPAEMAKMIQSVSVIKSDGRDNVELMKTGVTLLAHILKGKDDYGVKSPLITKTGKDLFETVTIQNKLSTYFKEKYIQDTIPKMLKALEPSAVIEIFDQYNFDVVCAGSSESVQQDLS